MHQNTQILKMSQELVITIEGPPTPQVRHRDTIRGGKRFKYDPLFDKKTSIRAALLPQLKDYTFNPDCYYVIKMFFYFEPPKGSHSWFYPPCTNNKDVDNLSKFVMDLLNEIAYPDDRFITIAFANKAYNTTPHTKIIIQEVPMAKIDKKTEKILKIFSPADLKELQENVEKILPFDPTKHTPLYAEIWAKATAQSIAKIADDLAEKLVKIKKIEYLEPSI